MKSFISLILKETIKLIKLLHVMALNTRVLFYIHSSQYKSAIYITLVLLRVMYDLCVNGPGKNVMSNTDI